ncbi:type 1 glutamine amidotransferase [uncultured Friedmanniella sp.]|uniref:type 1 glutamine amidotransferase n=1 Tax=uncultured Friedmanniella sp. TaxID=335381 RepID=UPI0035C97A48
MGQLVGEGLAPCVAVIQHAADCPPGRVGQWLVEAGCELDVFACHEGEEPPFSLDPYAGLLVLGGAMGADDDAAFPWLTPTKQLLARAVADELPTLGICLGLQLLAVACGGRVARSGTGPQLGVRPIDRTAASVADTLLTGLELSEAVHWNHDLVTELPPGAVVLTTSTGAVQSLRLGRRAWGVQFHPEVDPATLRRWADTDVAAGELEAAVADARLAEVERLDAALVPAWRGLSEQFAGVLTAPAGRVGSATHVPGGGPTGEQHP